MTKVRRTRTQRGIEWEGVGYRDSPQGSNGRMPLRLDLEMVHMYQKLKIILYNKEGRLSLQDLISFSLHSLSG